MQATAAAMPPTAPMASETGETWSTRAVVPTASDPPGPQARHHQLAVEQGAADAGEASDGGEDQRLRPTNCRRTRGRREADRPEQADLAPPLFDAQLEEERGEEHRRDDQEEAEVGEVLAEVGGAARRGEPFLAHRADGEARRDRIEAVAKAPPRTRRELAASAVPAFGTTRIDVSSP